MSVSLPSKEIYVVDVPEVREFTAEFNYNFWVPDESVSETGGMSTKFLDRQTDEIDSSFIQYAVTRAPRYVTLSFKIPRLSPPGNFVSDYVFRNNIFSSKAQNGSLISDNIRKVVTEDHFSTEGFAAVTFSDGDIDEKVYELVSGSSTMHSIDDPDHDDNVSTNKTASRFQALMPKQIKPHFLFRSLSQPAKTTGTRFFSKALGSTSQGKRVFSQYFKRLKEVVANAQISNKVFHDLTDRTMRDPSSPYTSDLHSIHKSSKKLKVKAIQSLQSKISENDFKAFVPFIEVKSRKIPTFHDLRGPEIVGYIIDKVEITADRKTTEKNPIIIDNPLVGFTADFEVKYNTTYVYSARSVSQFHIPAIDDDSGEVAMLKVLISSRPSAKVYVKTIETIAPPPPVDVQFTWNYERINPSTAQFDPQTGEPYEGTGNAGSLMVHWAFPPNSQRDVKKFQVFRRRTTDEAFELLKMYDFDDSVIRLPNNERPKRDLVEFLESPCTYFYDDEFHAGNHNYHDPAADQHGGNTSHAWSSTFIYAIACVDAHGMTSNYSAQFEVWFDPFLNKLQKKLISHSGAPKPYPNLYLEADTFVDTIKVSGPSSKRMKVYFNPEFYRIYDERDNVVNAFTSLQEKGKYVVQFINTDNQKSAAVDITINDQVKIASKKLAFPEVRFGIKRRPKIAKLRSF